MRVTVPAVNPGRKATRSNAMSQIANRDEVRRHYLRCFKKAKSLDLWEERFADMKLDELMEYMRDLFFKHGKGPGALNVAGQLNKLR
jgi:hypothetical protein